MLNLYTVIGYYESAGEVRFWQAHRPQLPKTDITGAPLVGARDAMILDIADVAGTVEPLLDDEIDALCERLNDVDREAE